MLGKGRGKSGRGLVNIRVMTDSFTKLIFIKAFCMICSIFYCFHTYFIFKKKKKKNTGYTHEIRIYPGSETAMKKNKSGYIKEEKLGNLPLK